MDTRRPRRFTIPRPTVLPDIVGTEYIVTTLKVHQKTAQAWCRKGVIPGLLPRIGPHYRINRAVFDNAIAAGDWQGGAA